MTPLCLVLFAFVAAVHSKLRSGSLQRLGSTNHEESHKERRRLRPSKRHGEGEAPWRTPPTLPRRLLDSRQRSWRRDNGEVCDALECVVAEMKKGETTIVMALSGMLKGEEAQLKCSPDFAGGATVDVTVEEIFVTKGVSFAKDKTIMKKVTRKGEGYDFPKGPAESDTDGAASLAGFTSKVSEFTAGNGEVSNTLECAVTRKWSRAHSQSPHWHRRPSYSAGTATAMVLLCPTGTPGRLGLRGPAEEGQAGEAQLQGPSTCAGQQTPQGARDPSVGRRGGICADEGGAAEAVGFPEPAQGMQCRSKRWTKRWRRQGSTSQAGTAHAEG